MVLKLFSELGLSRGYSHCSEQASTFFRPRAYLPGATYVLFKLWPGHVGFPWLSKLGMVGGLSLCPELGSLCSEHPLSSAAALIPLVLDVLLGSLVTISSLVVWVI